MRSDYLWIFLKGMAMGAADSVPGVSGGTIAFISGIYQRLLGAIRAFNLEALKLAARWEYVGLWRQVDGNFLLALFAGIGTAILLFSRFILYCLENYPELIWAFFFGLIVASALVIGKKIRQWNGPVIGAGLMGVLAGYAITIAVPAQTPENLVFVFLTGAVAICAMILPGISGSFILVLLAKYQYIFGAIHDLRIGVLLVFACGCAVGLLSFSHLLHRLLLRRHDLTVSFLTGLMVGALNKVWPWKQAVETYTDPHGKVLPLVETNVLPFSYTELTGREPYLVYAGLLMVVGFLMVWYLDRLSREEPTAEAADKGEI